MFRKFRLAFKTILNHFDFDEIVSDIKYSLKTSTFSFKEFIDDFKFWLNYKKDRSNL